MSKTFRFKTQLTFIIQLYKNIFVWIKAILVNTILDKCKSDFCVYDKKYALVIVTQSRRGEYGFFK